MADKTYLSFQQDNTYRGKTNLWIVISGEVFLGVVKWYSPWRRYTFYPERDSLFDSSCLKEITRFIDDEMQKRKLSKMKSKADE